MVTSRSAAFRWSSCAAAVLWTAVRCVSAAADVDAVALIVTATGTLTVSEDGREARRATALDWLRAGAILESPAGSTAVLALAGGRRYEVAPRSRARVAAEGIEILAGRARELPRIAPLPRLGALSPDAHAGSRAGALRVRGRRLRDLYPRADATSLAGSTTLAFSSLPGVTEYHVEVEDEEGETVFHVTTRGSAVPVSPDVLRPGQRYRWSVRGNSPEGLARGEAEFSTLDTEAVRARQQLRASPGLADDVASLALLAEVDRNLGLMQEARDGFARALERTPGDSALRQALDQVESRLREPAQSE